MDQLYLWSLPVLQDIQTRYFENENFMHTVSRVGDPAYAFTVIFPFISIIDTVLAADILMVSVIAEWSNTLLKWFIMEHRPYWWVREINMGKPNYQYLRQGPLTCETAPGSPSGHAMGSAALLYVLIAACIKYYSSRNKRNDISRKLMRITFWILYVVLLVLVSVSRMFVATHFPHQCLLGAITGFFIGYYFGDDNKKLTQQWHNSTKLKFLFYVTVATLISFISYWVQKGLGIDPQWSVKLAFKWCEQVEFVHVDTTPLFSLVRDTGLGLGLISVSPLLKQRPNQKPNIVISTVCVLAYSVALHLVKNVIPSTDVRIFYLCHTLLNATVPFVFIGCIPKFASIKQKLI